MGMNITYSGLESLIYEDLCKVVSAPLDLVMSQDAEDDNISTCDRGVFQGSKDGMLATVLFTYMYYLSSSIYIC